MQKDPEALLIEYRDADVDRRLHMFLAYRDLRDQFRTIDFSETDDQCDVDKVTTKSVDLIRYAMWRFVGALIRFMGFLDLGNRSRS